MIPEKADILLVYPPHRKITFVSAIPHLSAYAKKKGFKVDALDVPTLGLSIDDVIDYVFETRPRSVGISIPFTSLATKGLELIIKLNMNYPLLPLIVGGVHPTLCPEEFTSYAYVCSGDGEKALIKFLEWVKKPIYEREFLDKVLMVPTQINEVEAPDWNIVEFNKYHIIMPTGERAFPIQTSRGCPFNCIFCSSKFLFDGKVKYKTMAQVDKEIKNGIKFFGSEFIIFECENFTLNRNWFIELCRYLKKNKIKWWAQTRANLIKEDLAKIALDSGCSGFSFGIETGDPFILENIGKGITLEEGREAFRLMKRFGLRSAANFMVGHPWDTPKTIQRTLDYADEIDPDYFGVQISTPFPGTELRRIALEQGAKLKENWENYDTTRKDNYTPPGLKGLDLSRIRNKMEWDWFMRKPSRFLIRLRDKGTLRVKLLYIRRMLKLFALIHLKGVE